MMASESVLPTDLLNFKSIFKNYTDFKYFDNRTLMHIANFMGLEPITGLNTVNNLLSFMKKEIPIDHWAVRRMTKMFLVRELKMYFYKLRKDDTMIDFESLDTYTNE